MKKWIIAVVVTAMFGWAVYDMVGSKEANQEATNESGTTMTTEGTTAESAQDTGLSKGKLAPDFTLKRLNGGESSLSDFRGEKVMLNFWATWCPPCRAEMPDMEKFYQNEDVTILAVNMTQTEKARGDVNAFVQDFDLSFPILLDEDLDVVREYQVNPVPTSVFIDEEGKVQSIVQGAMNYDLMLQRYNAL